MTRLATSLGALDRFVGRAWLAVFLAAALAYLVAFGLCQAAEPAPMPRQAGPVPFAASVEAAAADIVRLPPDVARQTRYLDARHLAGEPEELAELEAILSDQVNSISRGPEVIRPRRVVPWLWAVNLDEYEWKRETFGDLARVNHYHLVPVKVNGEDTFAPMFGENAKAFQVLTELTGSRTPIVRADEFIFQTAIQAGRGGHGYYDFLGLGDKKLSTLEKLARLDRKGTRESFDERAEMVPASAVANPDVDRLILLQWGLKRQWWETRDAKTKKGERNVTTQLGDAFKFDARMIIWTLFNGMPGGALANAKDDLVDSAPDDIATDTGTTNTDARVHVGYSCWGCHDRAGLKSFTLWARRVYSAKTGASLALPDGIDPKLARELKVSYLADMLRDYKRAENDFAEAIEKASGLKPADRAKAWRRVWQRYLDPVGIDKAAAECGVTPAEFKRRFRQYADPDPTNPVARRVIDPVFAGLILDDPITIPRQYWEERFASAQLILAGATP